MKRNFWVESKKLFKQFKEHNLSEYTAQCTYYMVLAFIPFLILIVTLLQYTGISKDTFIWIIQTIIPSTMSESAINLVQEVYSKSLGTISVSAVFLIWSARRGFLALSKGLHSAYETKNNYLKQQVKSIVTTIILVVLVILGLVLSVFGNTIVEVLRNRFQIPSAFVNIFELTRIGVYGILFVVLVLMYRFIPGHKVKMKNHIPGALIATLGWYLCSFFFSMFIDMFKGFSIIYGSLTSITLAMMWVYFVMYIVLIGAEFNNFRIKQKQNTIKGL